ncbi:MAG: MBL fold metallo-hydrolase [Treponemataceae bacterium]|nr:MBL fold metallo-hydrolase [Treponemataceae bacterium]HOJ98827.1 MBL fold metallo-hydrolase [Termitinemataceae bacterium]HOM22538.1 MBL fold metallo-hydrolase [Termitinemataceae bacterium]HPQ00106.1 MBL fold metallo-hydrolase [Termitinemataceae bacterium]
MKVYFHFCLPSFTNCYILGTEEGDASPGALIIDPGCIAEDIINFLEDHSYPLLATLLTHDHSGHCQGLRTLRRIYEFPVYAVNHEIGEIATQVIHDGDILSIGPFKVEVISIPGHSSDSVVYKIGHFLFTGDVLSAGFTGSTLSSYGQTIQLNALQSKILSLPGDYQIFPGHGPPTTLATERQYNIGFDRRNHSPLGRSPWLREFL